MRAEAGSVVVLVAAGLVYDFWRIRDMLEVVLKAGGRERGC